MVRKEKHTLPKRQLFGNSPHRECLEGSSRLSSIMFQTTILPKIPLFYCYEPWKRPLKAVTVDGAYTVFAHGSKPQERRRVVRPPKFTQSAQRLKQVSEENRRTGGGSILTFTGVSRTRNAGRGGGGSSAAEPGKKSGASE
ncbi:hypothetical protein KSP40_PGU015339 [Platanthera guangdongensis]|uniref:Uncharacterized protein n=1 Tax=Platanthera guangdongensis TaxID=2320717 RepID=A0ABR2MQA6_9ASPA